MPPRSWGWPRVHPPQDVLAEGWKGVLLVVPKDFKYNRLALDVFNEGLSHLHGNLEEKEPAVAQFSWEKDAASNSTGEVRWCKPIRSPASLTHPLPCGYSRHHEILAFLGKELQLLVFFPHIHLV